MKERPILFSAPMVRAILVGTKTQTRRVVKPQPPAGHNWAGWCVSSTHRPDEGKATWAAGTGPHLRDAHRVACPYGAPGDRLWVRETWMDLQGTGVEVRTGDRSRYAYSADTPPGSYGDETRKDYGLKWRPSIHMPRAASRITLEVTGVRVERLQAISRGDCLDEGCPFPNMAEGDDPRLWFSTLWREINGAESWAANPWVWAVEFKRVEAP